MGDGEFKGYIIEKKKEGTDLWIPCNKAPELAANCRYKVDQLVPGQTYFFRVVAVSTVGQGKPSAPSCFIKMGEPFQDVLDRQAAMYAERRRLEALEEERRLAALEMEIEWYLGNWKETKIVPNAKFHIVSVGTKRVL